MCDNNKQQIKESVKMLDISVLIRTSRHCLLLICTDDNNNNNIKNVYTDAVLARIYHFLGQYCRKLITYQWPIYRIVMFIFQEKTFTYILNKAEDKCFGIIFIKQ